MIGVAIERDSNLAAILAVVRAHPSIGDFSLYRSVVELAPGWEMFTPSAAARPTLGATTNPSFRPV